jgi:hypothetical protein
MKLERAGWSLLLVFALCMPQAASALSTQAKSRNSHATAPSRSKSKLNKPKVAKPLKPAPTDLDPEVARKLNAIPVRGSWEHIVIHHSGTSVGKPKALDRFHRQRGMENGLAYHFLIGNGQGMKDGEIFIGDRWKRQIKGGHLVSDELNEVSIGICLIGNFDVDKPTKAQMDTLRALLQRLLTSTHLSSAAITTHCLIHPKHTDCPGKHFPFSALQTQFARK